jgi:hypothetical protein
MPWRVQVTEIRAEAREFYCSYGCRLAGKPPGPLSDPPGDTAPLHRHARAHFVADNAGVSRNRIMVTLSRA